MKTNPLTQPKVALIDDEDHPALPQAKWMVAVASGRDYAQRHGSAVTGICVHHENLTGGRTPFPNGADRDSRLIPLTREHSRLLMLLMVNVISQRCYVTLTRGRIFPATFTIPKRPRSNMAGHCEAIRQLGDTKNVAGEVRRRK
jgi:hypothetical protein